MFRQLDRIGVTNHVVNQHNTPHSGEMHATGDNGIMSRRLKPLCSNGQFAAHALDAAALFLVKETAVRPVPMGTEHAGTLTVH